MSKFLRPFIATITIMFLIGTLYLSTSILSGTPLFTSLLQTNDSSEEKIQIPGGTILNETHYVVHNDFSYKHRRVAYYKEGAWMIDWVDFSWWDVINGTQPPPVDVRLQAETFQYAKRVIDNEEQIPSLACAFIDPYRGIIYILLADMREKDKVLDILQPPAHIPVKFIPVKYSQTQLSEWHSLITQLFFNVSSPLYNEEILEQKVGLDVIGVGFPIANASIIIDLDIWTDEENEKFTEAQKDALLLHYVHIFAETILTPYAIPWEAVWFSEMDPYELDGKKDEFPTLIGGIKVETVDWFPFPIVHDSTLCFTAYRSGEKGFVMSGHATDLESVYQPSWWKKVGETTVDPHPEGGRYSDSAWVKLTARDIDNQIYGGWLVTGKRSSTYQELCHTVHYQGQESCGGSGHIIIKGKTCSHSEYGTLYNQMVARFTNNHPVLGDSGSPIFYIEHLQHGYVLIAGIYWGSHDTAEYAYSPIDGIENSAKDLGPLVVVF